MIGDKNVTTEVQVNQIGEASIENLLKHPATIDSLGES